MVLAQQESRSEPHPLAMFPSHIGSRSTWKVLGAQSFSKVSIPHWFSLNERLIQKSPVVVHVSIPHWFSLNDVIYAGAFHLLGFPSHIGSRSTERTKEKRFRVKVSIPHWFSLNPQGAFFYRVENPVITRTFPSHIGSRSTITPYPEMASQSLCFHPTLVLAQRG